MNVTRVDSVAGMILVAAGMMLAAASVMSIGEAQSWDVAAAFAADSLNPVRRVGMLLGIVGLALLVVATPALIVRASGTAGFGWTLAAWAAFAFGAMLFSMALGLTAIVMPALGELSESGAVSPQQIVDQLTRQIPIALAFLGGNLVFLSWIPMGVGTARAGVLPVWLGWFVALGAVAGWLGFLHVPFFQQFAGSVWPAAVVMTGVYLLRPRRGAR